MKKLILVLAILIASPVWAVLDVNLVEVDSDTVAVVYTGADSENLPRAFALTLTIDGTGTFTAVNDFKTGESTTADPGFGIYPARIVIDSGGAVTADGTPLADDINDPGAGSGLGSNNIVLEFGSLYYGDANAPLTGDTLCTIDFTAGTATQIVMEDEDTYRGGLVLEDGTQGEVAFTYTIETTPDECMKDIGQKYTNWVAAGSPDCWCYKWQGYGDIDGKEQGSGMTLKRIGSVDVTMFVNGLGKKRAQLIGDLVCADIDHLDQGSGMTLKAVGSVDVGIFVTWLGKKTGQLPDPPSYADDFNFWITPE